MPNFLCRRLALASLLNMVAEITMSSVSSPAESITEKGDSSSRLEKRITVDSVLTSDLEDQEERKFLEKKLVRKIDLRMSILVLIYILNYVCLCSLSQTFANTFLPRRSIEPMRGQF